MSLLLDALNKTSAKSSSSDDATNPDGLSQSAELSAEFKETQAPNPLSSPPADTDSKFSTGPSNVTSAPRELELESRPEDESETAIETELDGELSIDDATLDGLINDHPADRILETAVDSASERAVEDANRQAVQDSIEATAATVAQGAKDATITAHTGRSANNAEALAYATKEAISAADLEVTASEAHASLSSNTDKNNHKNALLEGDILISEDSQRDTSSTSGLIIDAEPEPESLAEEILHDAPLVAAYAKAQRKRKIIISSIFGLMICMLCAFVYRTFFYKPPQSVNTTVVDPELNNVQEVDAPPVVLEAINLNRIPARKTLPTLPPGAAVNLVQVTRQPANSGALNSAYQALATGQLNKASVLYSRLLKNPLTKVDALAGLASVSIAHKDFATAKQQLTELLVVDATNTYALAILAAMPDEANGEGADVDDKTSMLKSMQHANPENADIAYLLGNQLAKKSNWPDAQQAYFSAYSLAPTNAAYALNLAIALDQLGKPQQAREFYNAALRNAASTNAQIDVNAITRRLEQGN